MIVTSAPNKHRKGDCNCDMQLEQKGKPARSVHNLCNTLRWSRNGYRGLESYTCFHRRLKVQQPSANWHAHNLLKSEKTCSKHAQLMQHVSLEPQRLSRVRKLHLLSSKTEGATT